MGREDDQHGAVNDGAGRVQRVAAEDPGDPAQHDVSHRTAANGGDGAQQYRRQPAETHSQSLFSAGGGPRSQREGVQHRPDAIPSTAVDADEVADRGAR
jgi:hypothetical protein